MDCEDATRLADFYIKLLGWKITFERNSYVGIGKVGYTPKILFQTVKNYCPPVWPKEEGKQAATAHLDFLVKDLDEAVQFAKDCGASEASVQFSEKHRVMIDPGGHPFCLIKG